jgi:hypothetical protein
MTLQYTPSDKLVHASVKLISWFWQSTPYVHQERLKASWMKHADLAPMETVKRISSAVEDYVDNTGMDKEDAIKAFIVSEQNFDPAEVVRVADIAARIVQETFKDEEFFNEKQPLGRRTDGIIVEAQEMGHEHLAEAIRSGVCVPGSEFTVVIRVKYDPKLLL